MTWRFRRVQRATNQRQTTKGGRAKCPEQSIIPLDAASVVINS
jgi:hypothetical protein